MKIDIIFLLAFVAAVTGLVMLLSRYSGGGGGSSTTATPTSTPSSGGGWIPGYTDQGYRNGGTGAMQPLVWAN
jgi:uncharacterized membrane protein